MPPIRIKAPSPASSEGSGGMRAASSSAASRPSSRFSERFTSPTTTRIVDELLDEVVADRLTPRDPALAAGALARELPTQTLNPEPYTLRVLQAGACALPTSMPHAPSVLSGIFKHEMSCSRKGKHKLCSSFCLAP